VERVKPATIFALFRGFIFLIPSFLILPQILGATGIWLAMPFSEILTCACIAAFYLFCKWNVK
ncbi:MATE family efflux transporter, partial [Bacteroides uniformis]